jgi:DnaJ family protein B protein 12
MESNKDEALRCLVIARKHHEAGNIPSARKFCQKSIALFETQQALQLLATINASPSSSSGSTSAPQSTSSAAEEHPSAAGTKRRHAERSSSSNGTSGGIGGEKREYTPEQGEVVRRVRACKVTDYYEILALKRDCEDADVKKAYRKVCILCSSADTYVCELMTSYSSPSLYILIRTAHPVRTRRSNVGHDSLCATQG